MAQLLRSILIRVAHKFGRTSATRLGNLAMAALLLMAALLALFASLTINASNLQRETQAAAMLARDVLNRSAEVRNAVNESTRGERGYLLTHDPDFLQPYTEGRRDLQDALIALGALRRDDTAHRNRVAKLEVQSEQFLGLLASIVALEQAGHHDIAVARVRHREGRQAITAILAQLDSIDALERNLLAVRSFKNAASQRRLYSMVLLLGVSGLLLLLVGAVATIALRQSLRREEVIKAELRRIATTDELTGLANRHELFAALDRMIATSRRSGRPLSLAILDIDRFKLVNDLHGHPAGDEVIRRVGQMALELMREQDLVGRLGGEEFVVVFPDCQPGFALSASERLRAGIAALPILLPTGKALQITLSFGVTGLHDADDRTTLIARADEALYRAKKAGRDQVQLAA